MQEDEARNKPSTYGQDIRTETWTMYSVRYHRLVHSEEVCTNCEQYLRQHHGWHCFAWDDEMNLFTMAEK